MMTGNIIGLLFVSLNMKSATSLLISAFMLDQSTEPLDRHFSMVSNAISFDPCIRASLSRTYTKPLEIISGPATSFFSVEERVTTITNSPY